MKTYKKYLITGISSGLGKALTTKLIKEGNKVFGVSRSENLLNQLSKELKKNPKFNYLKIDLSKNSAWIKLIKSIKQKNFTPDVVVFNAAIFRNAASGSFNEEIIREVFEINFFSIIKGVEAILSAFPGNKIRIIAISSSSALKGSRKEGIAYASSKAALSVAFESLYQKYKNSNFSFGTVYFGPVKTGMNPNQDKKLFVISENQAVDCVINASNSKNPSFYCPRILFISLFLIKFLPTKVYFYLLDLMEKIHNYV